MKSGMLCSLARSLCPVRWACCVTPPSPPRMHGTQKTMSFWIGDVPYSGSQRLDPHVDQTLPHCCTGDKLAEHLLTPTVPYTLKLRHGASWSDLHLLQGRLPVRARAIAACTSFDPMCGIQDPRYVTSTQLLRSAATTTSRVALPWP